MTIEIRYSVMSPEGHYTTANDTEPAPPSMPQRLKTLEDKKVYLVDTGFGGSYRFMQQLQKWFRENMPGVITVRKRKPGNVFKDDTNELWEEIKAKGDAAVIGVGG